MKTYDDGFRNANNELALLAHGAHYVQGQIIRSMAKKPNADPVQLKRVVTRDPPVARPKSSEINALRSRLGNRLINLTLRNLIHWFCRCREK